MNAAQTLAAALNIEAPLRDLKRILEQPGGRQGITAQYNAATSLLPRLKGGSSEWFEAATGLEAGIASLRLGEKKPKKPQLLAALVTLGASDDRFMPLGWVRPSTKATELTERQAAWYAIGSLAASVTGAIDKWPGPKRGELVLAARVWEGWKAIASNVAGSASGPYLIAQAIAATGKAPPQVSRAAVSPLALLTPLIAIIREQ